MNRRQFLSAGAALSAAVMQIRGFGSRAEASEATADAVSDLKRRPFSNVAQIARRPFGNTGIQLSIIGFPGFCLNELDQGRVNRLVSESFERGINYFDVAPKYGNAEERLGPALEPYRKNVFLACKTAERTKEGAERELADSLETLRTDHFDLYQLHHITNVEKDVDVAFGKGGAMEALIEAKKDGRVRHLGFSAHSVEAAMAAMERYDFDSAMFAVNYASWFKGGFGSQLVEAAESKGVARFALKALARQRWGKDDPRRAKHPRTWYEPITDIDEAELGLRFTLSRPVTAALPPAEERMHRLAMLLGMDYEPITDEQEATLAGIAKDLRPLFAHG